MGASAPGKSRDIIGLAFPWSQGLTHARTLNEAEKAVYHLGFTMTARRLKPQPCHDALRLHCPAQGSSPVC